MDGQGAGRRSALGGTQGGPSKIIYHICAILKIYRYFNMDYFVQVLLILNNSNGIV